MVQDLDSLSIFLLLKRFLLDSAFSSRLARRGDDGAGCLSASGEIRTINFGIEAYILFTQDSGVPIFIV